MAHNRPSPTLEKTVFRILGELDECSSWDRVAHGIVHMLDRIVGGENPAYNEVSLPSAEVTATLMYDYYMDEALRTLPAYNYYARQHPLMRLGDVSDSVGQVLAFSQSLSLAEIERNPVYNEALRFTDARDQILFSLLPGDDRMITICQNRMKWGYSGDEIYRMTYFASRLTPFLQGKYAEIQSAEAFDSLIGLMAKTTGIPEEQLKSLTPSEIRICSALVRGMSYSEISCLMDISERTVGAHAGSLLDKMKLNNRYQLASCFRDLLYPVKNT